MEKMNILGIDYGDKRIGLSYADSQIGVAVPVQAATEHSFEERLGHILSEIKQRGVEKLVVGYPLNMDGTLSRKALDVDAFIEKLRLHFNGEIVRVDERLSSYQAESDINSFNSRKTRTVAARKKNRKTGQIDSRASAIFLQEYLDGGEAI